ncbi:conjugal transfer protein TraB [Streptomyces sp. NPDC093269]|uniref:conjugal transfer protein TraB n=1 Tax=Streptomyces sp. NPDC093269 TaxID=3366038 RepID=UPI00380466E7
MSDNTAIEPTNVQTGAEVAAENDSTLPAPRNNTPAKPSWGGAIYGILNFVSLALRIMALATAAALLKEQLHFLKARMHDDAVRARRLAGHLAQAGVDPHFQAQALEVAASFERVAEASGELADAADGMEANANGVRDAHETEYGGIYETTQALPYEQPKPGFNAIR